MSQHEFLITTSTKHFQTPNCSNKLYNIVVQPSTIIFRYMLQNREKNQIKCNKFINMGDEIWLTTL